MIRAVQFHRRGSGMSRDVYMPVAEPTVEVVVLFRRVSITISFDEYPKVPVDLDIAHQQTAAVSRSRL